MAIRRTAGYLLLQGIKPADPPRCNYPAKSIKFATFGTQHADKTIIKFSLLKETENE